MVYLPVTSKVLLLPAHPMVVSEKVQRVGPDQKSPLQTVKKLYEADKQTDKQNDGHRHL